MEINKEVENRKIRGTKRIKNLRTCRSCHAPVDRKTLYCMHINHSIDENAVCNLVNAVGDTAL